MPRTVDDGDAVAPCAPCARDDGGEGLVAVDPSDGRRRDGSGGDGLCESGGAERCVEKVQAAEYGLGLGVHGGRSSAPNLVVADQDVVVGFENEKDLLKGGAPVYLLHS